MLCPRAAILLVLAAAEVSWALTDKDKSAIVQLHNTYRSGVNPPAADMLKMEWDTTLENLAKSYAKKCIWDHNPDRGRRGENLFMISTPTVNVDTAVEKWYNEYKYYDFATSTCAANQMCGHYTQVVWATSNKVGCGENFCEKVEGSQNTHMSLLVCNYEPPGNIRGRKPYTEGSRCSSCPPNYTCVNSLCVQEIDLEDTTSTFFTKEETLPTKRPTPPGLSTPFKVDVRSEEVSTSHATTEATTSILQTSFHSLVPSTNIEVELEDTTESYIATETNGFQLLLSASSRMSPEIERDRGESSQPPFKPEQAITPEKTALFSKTPSQEYAEGFHLFYHSGAAESQAGGGTQSGGTSGGGTQSGGTSGGATQSGGTSGSGTQSGGTSGTKAGPAVLFAIIVSTYLSVL